MRMLAGILNRRSSLTYCNVLDTCCFYGITSSKQATYITFYVYMYSACCVSLFLKYNTRGTVKIQYPCNTR